MDLILQTFGLSLSRDNSCFVITTSDGNKQRLTPEGITTIQLTKGIKITSDAILLALQHDIEVLILERDGTPAGRFWSARYGSISNIRKGQLMYLQSQHAVEWIKKQISKKILNQQAMILSCDANTPQLRHNMNKAVSRLEEYLLKIKALKGEKIRDISATLRGWEGAASRIYFETINQFLPEQYKFSHRSQHPALDVANALFNYAYGILYGKIEGCMIRAGIDPYIGLLHRDEYNRPVLVYDVIEPYRIWADYVVISILCQNIITDEYYSRRTDNSVWLEPLGRRVIIQSMNDYLDEIITHEGIQRSRATHIQLSMQKLAQTFKSCATVNRKI